MSVTRPSGLISVMAIEPRLTAEFWVTAYMSRLRLADIPHFLRARGDATAGAVFVLLNTLDGQAQLYQRTLGADFKREWGVVAQGNEAEVEAAMARQRGFDPDIWVIEVEDAQGRHLLDEPGLRD